MDTLKPGLKGTSELTVAREHCTSRGGPWVFMTPAMVQFSEQSCHNLVMPRSHNGLWRVRMHGLAASWDRDRCKTCHESGVCVRCHATERPLNHVGNWGTVHGLAASTSDNEHCATCHRGSFCVQCHTQAR